MSNDRKPSRRDVLAGSVALLATAGGAAKAAPAATHIVELHRAWLTTRAELDAAQRVMNAASERYWAARPAVPAVLAVRGPDVLNDDAYTSLLAIPNGLYRPLGHVADYAATRGLRALIKRRRPGWKWAAGVLPIAEEHDRRTEAAREETGLNAAEAAHDAIEDRLIGLTEAILDADAASPGDLVVQADVLESDDGLGDADRCARLLRSIRAFVARAN